MGMEKVKGRNKLKDTERYGSGDKMEGVELQLSDMQRNWIDFPGQQTGTG